MGQTKYIGRVATSVATDDGWTRVTYHNTVVVKFNATTIVLNSGGWKTHTTKTRMNQAANQYALGYCVTQKDFDWFVILKTGKVVPFVDGMEIAR